MTQYRIISFQVILEEVSEVASEVVLEAVSAAESGVAMEAVSAEALVVVAVEVFLPATAHQANLAHIKINKKYLGKG